MKHALFTLSWLVFFAGCRPSSRPDLPPPELLFSTATAWPDSPVVAPPAAGRLVVTNNLDDTLSFFDVGLIGGATFPELKRVPVGLNPVEIEAPHHAALAPKGAFLFIGLANSAPGVGTGPHGSHGSGTVEGTLLKVRASDNRVVGTARLDPNPGDLAISPDGTRLAVTHFDLLRISDALRGAAPDPDARVFLVNAQTMEVTDRIRICPAPHGVLFSKDGKRLYLACYSDEIAVIQLDAPGLPVTRVKVASNAGDAYRPVYQPYAIAQSPLADGDVFISCLASGEVRVLKADTLTIDETRSRLVGGSPFIPAFSADGNTLWVPHQGDDRISDLDPLTGVQRRVLTPLKGSCTNIHQVLPAPDPRFLLAVCEGYHVTAGTVVVLDALSGATVSTTAVGVYPDYVGLLKTPTL